MNRVKFVFALAMVMMVSGVEVVAQDALDLKKMSAQMRTNQEEIRRYSWDSKIVYAVEGVAKRSDTYSVRYNANGFLERMQTGSTTLDTTKVRFPDGKKLSKKDLEAAYEFIKYSREQLDVYLSPLFAEKAVSTATPSTEGDDLVLTANSVVTTGDTVVITLVQSSLRPLSMSVVTRAEGTPLTLDVTFASMDYGPNHLARSITKTTWKGLGLEIDITNSNYKE